VLGCYTGDGLWAEMHDDVIIGYPHCIHTTQEKKKKATIPQHIRGCKCKHMVNPLTPSTRFFYILHYICNKHTLYLLYYIFISAVKYFQESNFVF
jgi:hypothetical protein